MKMSAISVLVTTFIILIFFLSGCEQFVRSNPICGKGVSWDGNTVYCIDYRAEEDGVCCSNLDCLGGKACVFDGHGDVFSAICSCKMCTNDAMCGECNSCVNGKCMLLTNAQCCNGQQCDTNSIGCCGMGSGQTCANGRIPGTAGCCNSDANCDDQNVCTKDTCGADTGECKHEPLDCDDGDDCTEDSCDPAMGCVNPPVDESVEGQSMARGLGIFGKKVCCKAGFTPCNTGCCQDGYQCCSRGTGASMCCPPEPQSECASVMDLIRESNIDPIKKAAIISALATSNRGDNRAICKVKECSSITATPKKCEENGIIICCAADQECGKITKTGTAPVIGEYTIIYPTCVTGCDSPPNHECDLDSGVTSTKTVCCGPEEDCEEGAGFCTTRGCDEDKGETLCEGKGEFVQQYLEGGDYVVYSVCCPKYSACYNAPNGFPICTPVATGTAVSGLSTTGYDRTGAGYVSSSLMYIFNALDNYNYTESCGTMPNTTVCANCYYAGGMGKPESNECWCNETTSINPLLQNCSISVT